MTSWMEVFGRVSGRQRWPDAETLESLAEAFRSIKVHRCQLESVSNAYVCPIWTHAIPAPGAGGPVTPGGPSRVQGESGIRRATIERIALRSRGRRNEPGVTEHSCNCCAAKTVTVDRPRPCHFVPPSPLGDRLIAAARVGVKVR